MNTYRFKRFFIPLLFSDKVVKNSNFYDSFYRVVLCLRVSWGTWHASVLIVPQVFMMYYGGFYCACICIWISLMELNRGLSFFQEQTWWNLRFFYIMWENGFRFVSSLRTNSTCRGIAMAIGFNLLKKREVERRTFPLELHVCTSL